MIDRRRLVEPTVVTRAAALTMALVILATAVFLLLQYPSLPDLLPVHFSRYGEPNGWQYRTLPRVFTPVGVQVVLGTIGCAVAGLLLSRPHGRYDADAADVRAAGAAAEAVVLLALVWVTFQSYAAFSLSHLWTAGGSRLPMYNLGALAGGMASIFVAWRAQRLLGRPEPRPYDPSHWRLGQLYKNSADTALFVPTRDGRRWTLNFGRPVAGALLGLVLVAGILGPTLLLALAFR